MCRILSRPLYLWHKRLQFEILMGCEVIEIQRLFWVEEQKQLKIIPISIQAGSLLTLSDSSTPWAAAGSTAPVFSACMHRPLTLHHSRTSTVSFSTRCCFETYWDFDTAIKRKSRQASKGCHNTAASPCGPTQSKKFCILHWKVWDHSPYSQELHHVTASI